MPLNTTQKLHRYEVKMTVVTTHEVTLYAESLLPEENLRRYVTNTPEHIVLPQPIKIRGDKTVSYDIVGCHDHIIDVKSVRIKEVEE